ncbi:NAD-binding protein [Sulfurimonas autotrophica]|uniref:TrkA-N domain protein n=1 Tax=Sulfurimonas autotrophica (strain ATCC BAA-671 / DSM 16294 / JCM 11897 / OK10) TaxID=563040 RepID=E0UUA2_SULAO|nr:NAD-binding protein [Sulfurimonas autotrophica]ADN09477.1 TrkA-N domain protein [Sulfurimonas autotrophica DSM 16294]
MAKTTALIFGYNKYAHEIIRNVKDKYNSIKVFSLDENDKAEGLYELEYFDLSDEWADMQKSVDMKNSMAFCVLEDTAENIFLTISLRANFKDLTIIAISSNKESANKLLMAGANKVIPLTETTSDIITNMLEKPISHKILHDILYEKSSLKIAQVQIGEESEFKDEQLTSIDWTRYNGIIVLSVMHEDLKSEFIYSSKAKRHIIKSGDVLIVVGFEKDIQDFENKIRSKRYVNWSHWSW